MFSVRWDYIGDDDSLSNDTFPSLVPFKPSVGDYVLSHSGRSFVITKVGFSCDGLVCMIHPRPQDWYER